MRWSHFRHDPGEIKPGDTVETGIDSPRTSRHGLPVEVIGVDGTMVEGRIVVDGEEIEGTVRSNRLFKFDPHYPVWVPPFENEGSYYYDSDDKIFLER